MDTAVTQDELYFEQPFPHDGEPHFQLKWTPTGVEIHLMCSCESITCLTAADGQVIKCTECGREYFCGNFIRAKEIRKSEVE